MEAAESIKKRKEQSLKCLTGGGGVVVCNARTIAGLKRRIQHVQSVLQRYSPITDAYVLDFFVEDHWAKLLPASWQSFLDQLDPVGLSEFISRGEIHDSASAIKVVPPLTLLAFRQTAFALSLPRNLVPSTEGDDEEESSRCFEGADPTTTTTTTAFWERASDELTEDGDGQRRKGLHDVFRRHVKPKKQHEITRLTKVVKCVLDKTSCRHVVDIGSGQGHLSRLLAFSTTHDKVRVTSMEAESSHVMGARKMDLQASRNLEKCMRKQQSTTTTNSDGHQADESVAAAAGDPSRPVASIIQLPTYVNRFIPADTDSQTFLNLLRTTADGDGNEEPDDDDKSFSLVGLHTCGNLAATLLKVFARSPQATAVFSAPCCYMKLDTGHSEQDGGGTSYPLSQFVAAIPQHGLSYVAREVACHALEKHLEKVRSDAASLKVHCYRATLESLVVKHFPHMAHMGLRSVKNAHRITFSCYAEQALKRTSVRLPQCDLLCGYADECLGRWQRVLTFYTLRLLLAKLVETLILLDRMVYLFEEGNDSCVVPLFDPLISPRNHVLIAVKSLV